VEPEASSAERAWLPSSYGTGRQSGVESTTSFLVRLLGRFVVLSGTALIR
jgi:hypothetical protein